MPRIMKSANEGVGKLKQIFTQSNTQASQVL